MKLTKKPKISIVVIALNSENTIKKTLLSIKKQSFSSFEVICVDDGSTDETLKIMQKFAIGDERYKIISHKGKKGCISSRYDGLQKAIGEYIMFIDSDDSYESKAFDIAYKEINNEKFDVCEFGVNIVPTKNNTLSREQIKEYKERYVINDCAYDKTEDILKACFVSSKIKVNVWNKIYRTELVKKAFSQYDSEMIVMEEDWLFSFAVLSLAKKYKVISDKLINYSIGSGISTNNKVESDYAIIQHANILRVFKLIKECANERKIQSKIKNEVLNSIRLQLMRFAINDFANSCSLDKCQLFLDTLLQYCEINDVLITFSIMASEGRFIDTESAINKLRICQLPSEEAKAYVSSLSLYEMASNIKKIEDYYKNTTTWRVGRFLTFIPRKIKDRLIEKGTVANKDEGIDMKKMTIPSFRPLLPLTEIHNFSGFRTIINEANGTIINEDSLLALEYTRDFKLLLVTDNYKGNCVKEIINYCLKHNVYLSIIDFNSNQIENANVHKNINVILCKDLEKLYLTKFVDLYDGLVIDASDYFTTVNHMRSDCRNTLILTNKSIRVGLREKYCIRKEFRLKDYFDWLIYGNLVNKKDLISVIIPTLNAGKEFDNLLYSIENQKNIANPEIIIIDSGSKDDTIAIAKKHNAKVYSISKEKFSHSKVRNMGADLAKGDYLLFTTQDAIPSSDLTFCRLLNEMYTYQVSAISPAEEYRKDADLFSKMMIYEYKFNYFNQSPIDVKIAEINADYFEIRRSTSLDDVMCLTKKSIFKKYQYRFSYAEDCDYGYRLIFDGHSIERTNKIKVIHSHNRSSDYFLKRSTVDAITMRKIYSNFPLALGDYRILCNKAISFYMLTNIYACNLRKNKNSRADYIQMQALSKECIKSAGSTMRKVNKIKEFDFDQMSKNKTNTNLINLLKQIQIFVKNDKPILQDLITLENYIDHIIWLKSHEIKMFKNNEKEEIICCLEKYAACQIGFFMGSYLSIHKGSNKQLDEILGKMDLNV